ncbi:MAG: hypothetical protein VX764_03970 [Planctomycetota bacterium]|nr:hypothetical protein [Planctomycetota bacterium]
MSSCCNGQGNTPCHAYILLLLLTLVPCSAYSVQDPVVLEDVKFLLFGRERQEVGQVQLQGQNYQIQLFDSRISTYYTVTITAEDLISTVPVPAENALRILQERASLIEARELLREQRRKERREKALARRSTDESRSDAKPGEGRRTSASRRGSDTSASGAGSPLRDPVEAGSSLERGTEVLQLSRQVCEELLQRSNELMAVGRGCQQSLRTWADASDSNSRLFTKLREESYSLVEKTESIEGQIRTRLKEIDWTLDQVDSKDIRGRDLPEVADRIRRRVLQCEQRVDSLAVLLSACSDGLKTLGEPIVAVAESQPEEDPRSSLQGSKEQPARPEPSSSRTVSSSSRGPSVVVNRPSIAETTTASSSRRDQARAEVASDPVSSTRGDEAEQQSEAESESGLRSDGVTTLLLGGILGALLVLVLGTVLRRL